MGLAQTDRERVRLAESHNLAVVYLLLLLVVVMASRAGLKVVSGIGKKEGRLII